MIKIKKSILSALLFSFLFLVVHDYAVHQTSPNVMYEHYLIKETSLKKVDSKTSLESQLHENIHNLLTVEADTPLNTFILPNTQPVYTELSFSSHISFILERPPLLT